MDGAVSTAAAPERGSGRVTLAVLVFILAVALFGAAFYFLGGMDLVAPFLGGGVATPVKQPAASGSTSASITPTPFDAALGKRMYVEQVESQGNLGRLAGGKIATLTVDGVAIKGGAAVVSLNASFVDGTSATGAMQLVKRGSSWFFFSITGMRDDKTGGLADSVNSAASMEQSETLALEFRQAGIRSVDAAVVRTLFDQQSANQEVFNGLLDGRYVACGFGKPVRGAGTVTVPTTLVGKSGPFDRGSVVLIRKTVAGTDLLFLAKFVKK